MLYIVFHACGMHEIRVCMHVTGNMRASHWSMNCAWYY